MNGTSNHPSPDLLLSYSAGTLSPSHALCIATHLEFCPMCRAAHQRNNAVGGTLIESLASQGDQQNKVSDTLKDKVMGLISNEEVNTDAPAPIHLDEANSSSSANIPRVLKSLIRNGFGDLDWQRISTTAKSCQLFTDEVGNKISLLKLKPGGRVAKHDHLGKEYTVVLTGAFSDEDGVYRAGDFLIRDSNDAHSPIATKDAECICLTLQEAPLQFTGWLFKLLNPWLRNQFHAS